METLLSSGYQGTVYLVEEGGHRYVAKRPVGAWLTRWLRRAMLRREHAAYRRLAGIAGVPHCEGLGPDGELRLAFVPGKSLRDAGHELADPAAFFQRLQRLIEAIHAAGVAHADLKRKDNILVDAQEQPWLIDFGSALLAGSERGGWLFHQACRTDLNAWFKIKYQFVRTEPSTADLAVFDPTWAEKLARVLRRAWRRLTRRQQRRSGSAARRSGDE